MMKVTKKNMREFVLEQLEQQEEKLKKTYKETISAKQKEILLANETYQSIAKDITQIDRVTDRVINNLELLMSNKEIAYTERYYGLLSKLKRIKPSYNPLQTILEDSTFECKVIDSLRREREEKLNEVVNNYHAVLAEMEKISRPTEILKYLKSLGFNMSRFEKEEKSLAVQINKEVLFMYK